MTSTVKLTNGSAYSALPLVDPSPEPLTPVRRRRRIQLLKEDLAKEKLIPFKIIGALIYCSNSLIHFVYEGSSYSLQNIGYVIDIILSSNLDNEVSELSIPSLRCT